MLADRVRDISDDRDRQVGYRESSGQMRDGLRHTVGLIDQLRSVHMLAAAVDVSALLHIHMMVMVVRGQAGRHHAEQQDESRRDRGAKLPVHSHTPEDSLAAHHEQPRRNSPDRPDVRAPAGSRIVPSIDQPQGDVSA